MSRRLDFFALAMSLPPSGLAVHPNRQAFEGVLTRVGEPSTRPPNGAQGHRVLIPAEVAERRLETLIGMAVDVSDDLTDHTTQKIGVITSAWLDGSDLRVQGFLYAKDFPGVLSRLRRDRSHLGMSYEITAVQVEDESAEVWTLADFVFTGAAILKRTAAAYERTSIAASRAARRAWRREMRTKLMTELESLRDRMGVAIAAMQEAEADEEADEEAGGTPAEDEEATFPPTKKEEEEEQEDEKAGGAQTAQGEHEDEAQDLALLKKLLTKIERRQAAKATIARPVAARAVDQRLTKIEAAMELLTDASTSMGQLLTDMAETVKTLATDRARRGPNGGKMSATTPNGHEDRPRRKTMSASESYQFLAKYGLSSDQHYTTHQVDEALRVAGVTDPTQRISVKHFLESTGQLNAAA